MIDWQRLPERLNADPEFRLAGREWTATLRLEIGESAHALHIDAGVVRSVEETAPGAEADVFVRAPESDWQELLAETPRPFYQDLTGAAVHHGVRLPRDTVSYAAYYPALRRLIQVMRDVRLDGEQG